MKNCDAKNAKNVLSLQKNFKRVKIDCFDKSLAKKYLHRLLEIGFTKNTEIKIIRRSLRGKTLLVEIRGFVVSLQTAIADKIMVKL